MILDKLILKNFKSHKDREVNFGKITVLIGHNNAGKSSILQSLIMLAQSAKQDQTILRSNNDVIDLGKLSDIVSLGDVESNISIGIKFKKIIQLGGNYGKVIEPELANCLFRVTSSKHNISEVYVGVESQHTQFDVTWTPNTFSGHLIRPFENTSHELQLIQLQGFIPRLQISNAADKQGKTLSQIYHQAFSHDFGGDFFKDVFASFYYVPFHRTIGKLGVPLITESRIENIVQRDPEKTNSALLSTLSKTPSLRKNVARLYTKIFDTAMEPHNLDADFQIAEERDVQRISLLFEKGNFASSIANVGGGINQLILLFTILTGTPKNSVICIEEPEIHLHPEKQTDLMKRILDIAIKDEKQIILTTHSEYILYPLLAAVSKGKLRPEDLVIHYFTLDEESNLSNVEHLDVNEHGQVMGGLKGFWDATTSAMKDFVREENDE